MKFGDNPPSGLAGDVFLSKLLTEDRLTDGKHYRITKAHLEPMLR